mmetsp:Transcript_26295/g.56464  ORF Transcript_26295/g.56464 Transcript_26295/m.56464 type:complete len:80 (-) Transcript_26295:115-354(-)
MRWHVPATSSSFLHTPYSFTPFVYCGGTRLLLDKPVATAHRCNCPALVEDKDACTTMANSQKPTSHTRHMDIKFHVICE